MDPVDQVGDLRHVLDSITKFQKKLDELDALDIPSTLGTTLQDLNLKIGHLEEAMLQMQSSMLSQTSLRQEVHTGVGFKCLHDSRSAGTHQNFCHGQSTFRNSVGILGVPSTETNFEKNDLQMRQSR